MKLTGTLTNIRPVDDGVTATLTLSLVRFSVHISNDLYEQHAALITSGGQVTIGGDYAGAGIRVRKVTA